MDARAILFLKLRHGGSLTAEELVCSRWGAP